MPNPMTQPLYATISSDLVGQCADQTGTGSALNVCLVCKDDLLGVETGSAILHTAFAAARTLA
jgi:hypothetical protein